MPLFVRTIFAAALTAAGLSSPALADRMVLWTLVHDQCVVHARAGEAPKPCEALDISQGEDAGIAVLKDREGVAQYLIIPTRRVTGIEDPFVLSKDAPPYFGAAWAARDRVAARLGQTLPREAISIAVNSEFARSQDQLHLHVDCVDPVVMKALAADLATFDDHWRPMAEPLNGRVYWVRRVDSTDLSDVAPFELLADGLPGARQRMGLMTLVAVGASFSGKPGFVLLADHAELEAGGHGEDLQDHTCATAKGRTAN